MCRIIGYIGNKNVSEVLFHGLYSLEYRGYDSAGMAISDGKDLKITKCVGRVSNLEDKYKKDNNKGFFGIAHTRWATNGGASLENAHPHSVGKVTLVHNGIIENADNIKLSLIDKGYSFSSETDSEVIAAFLDNELKNNNILNSIQVMRKELKGSYALGIIIEGEECIYAVRKDSPLLIGVNRNEFFLASDIAAILKYTNKYFLIDEGETAVLERNDYKVYRDEKIIHKDIITTDSKSQSLDKFDYEHFMLKEIMEEPIVLKNLIDSYKNGDNIKYYDISNYEEVHIVACGSAMYAGLIGQALIEEEANIKVNVYAASEYRYKKKIFNLKTLVILVSQSGETADTIAAMREVKEMNIPTLGIINNPNSTMARECDYVILINAGVEVAVATTKAYINQVCVLALIAYTTSLKKGLSNDVSISEFESIPNLLHDVLNNTFIYEEIAKDLYEHNNCFFIGRGIDYAICMEGSLKLKEVSYIHSEAYQAGELKHGTISLIEKGIPVIAVMSDRFLKDKTLSNLKETLARGAYGIVITTSELDDFKDFRKVTLPSVNSFCQSLLIVPTLQLISYYVSLYRGCDIDKPKNLAKSVTVE